ncbi:SH3 domain-containing protein [Flavivirga spongiicola]|uniref:SH3 domain-containing protein n=1 Tax=Flavivirga spongiicola TaxID=421621 RepID=A0ABU7XTM7_9FLAO|nr:SH3 domain-containing protein [Flavivirga sp. MEBiC05379]MDO5979133.1 SH3 domain-containing protein [Flavivirga sp. MEBiC05379]
MKTYINIIALLIVFNFAQAQEIRYVKADNGLVLREKPNRGSGKITKLDYGTQLEIIEHTNLKLDVLDDNEVISGEWVKISTIDNDDSTNVGYVFNGYLTETELRKRFKINLDTFTLTVDSLEAWASKTNQDTVNIDIDLGETIEGKIIRIKHHIDYKNIQLFQRHENSITIMDEGPHCDLTDWKHYYSSWKPLKSISKDNQFKTNSYSEEAWNKFIKIDINEFKQAVKTHCGENWATLIKDVKTVNTYPSGVSISTIYLKVIFTKMNDEKIEKIIAFGIPMGC